jgi:hypothetical protein
MGGNESERRSQIVSSAERRFGGLRRLGRIEAAYARKACKRTRSRVGTPALITPGNRAVVRSHRNERRCGDGNPCGEPAGLSDLKFRLNSWASE